MTNLQQSSTLGPFVQHFVSFALIARMTSNDQIRGIITATTIQGDNMVNVILLPKPLFAIIALPFLSLILKSDILRGMPTTILAYASSSVPGMHKDFLRVFDIALLTILLVCIFIGFVVFHARLIFAVLAFMAQSCAITIEKLRGSREAIPTGIARTHRTLHCFHTLPSQFCLIGFITSSTNRIQSIRTCLLWWEEFKGSGLFLLAIGANFVTLLGKRSFSYIRLLKLFMTAFLTVTSKFTLAVFVTAKVFTGNRKGAVASRTAFLRYTIIHAGTHFLASRSRMFPASLDHHIIFLNYTTNPPLKPVQGVRYAH